ncbi:hypothetical protein EB796_007879 [Bugula neritina]|uniref:Guanylate-binding protein N-terminal domain-containing protein n=1 Tax=Bugula neritina TaxID=10212 RepID=A0A7J7K6H1_BUGNE|nr:hypothetical protein EB796_007879 [Bugula neritina]
MFFLILIGSWERVLDEEAEDVTKEMERILEETLDMFHSDKCVSKHANSAHTLENLELLRNKKHVIENNRKTFEQLVAKKKQEGQTENELQKMRDEFEENPLKQDEQQTILEMEGKEKKLNKQQLKEKYAKLAHEKKALNNEAIPADQLTNKDDIGEGDTPIFQVKEVEALINANDEIKEKKFFLVSITGVYRSGKSFLLNLMQTYLDHYQKNGNDIKWEKSKKKIEGGKWRQSTESVTHGIWIWNRGFLINDIVIVLIDCQGTGDSLKSTPTLDNLILYLGLQLANVQILNLKSVLQTNDLERIDMCQHFSDLDSESALLNCSLLYLLRDYNGDKEYGRKDSLFTRIADNAESDVIRNFASGIEKTFQEIATFAVPGPGSKVTDVSDGESLKVDSVDMTFLLAAKKLFRYVFLERQQFRGALCLMEKRL